MGSCVTAYFYQAQLILAFVDFKYAFNYTSKRELCPNLRSQQLIDIYLLSSINETDGVPSSHCWPLVAI